MGKWPSQPSFSAQGQFIITLLSVYTTTSVSQRFCQEMTILPTTTTPLVPSRPLPPFLSPSLLSCFSSFPVSTVNQHLLAEGVHSRAHQAPVLAAWNFFDLLHQSVGSSESRLLSGLPLPPLSQQNSRCRQIPTRSLGLFRGPLHGALLISSLQNLRC